MKLVPNQNMKDQTKTLTESVMMREERHAKTYSGDTRKTEDEADQNSKDGEVDFVSLGPQTKLSNHLVAPVEFLIELTTAGTSRVLSKALRGREVSEEGILGSKNRLYRNCTLTDSEKGMERNSITNKFSSSEVQDRHFTSSLTKRINPAVILEDTFLTSENFARFVEKVRNQGLSSVKILNQVYPKSIPVIQNNLSLPMFHRLLSSIKRDQEGTSPIHTKPNARGGNKTAENILIHPISQDEDNLKIFLVFKSFRESNRFSNVASSLKQGFKHLEISSLNELRGSVIRKREIKMVIKNYNFNLFLLIDCFNLFEEIFIFSSDKDEQFNLLKNPEINFKIRCNILERISSTLSKNFYLGNFFLKKINHVKNTPSDANETDSSGEKSKEDDKSSNYLSNTNYGNSYVQKSTSGIGFPDKDLRRKVKLSETFKELQMNCQQCCFCGNSCDCMLAKKDQINLNSEIILGLKSEINLVREKNSYLTKTIKELMERFAKLEAKVDENKKNKKVDLGDGAPIVELKDTCKALRKSEVYFYQRLAAIDGKVQENTTQVKRLEVDLGSDVRKKNYRHEIKKIKVDLTKSDTPNRLNLNILIGGFADKLRNFGGLDIRERTVRIYDILTDLANDINNVYQGHEKRITMSEDITFEVEQTIIKKIGELNDKLNDTIKRNLTDQSLVNNVVKKDLMTLEKFLQKIRKRVEDLSIENKLFIKKEDLDRILKNKNVDLKVEESFCDSRSYSKIDDETEVKVEAVSEVEIIKSESEHSVLSVDSRGFEAKDSDLKKDEKYAEIKKDKSTLKNAPKYHFYLKDNKLLDLQMERELKGELLIVSVDIKSKQIKKVVHQNNNGKLFAYYYGRNKKRFFTYNGKVKFFRKDFYDLGFVNMEKYWENFSKNYGDQKSSRSRSRKDRKKDTHSSRNIIRKSVIKKKRFEAKKVEKPVSYLLNHIGTISDKIKTNIGHNKIVSKKKKEILVIEEKSEKIAGDCRYCKIEFDERSHRRMDNGSCRKCAYLRGGKNKNKKKPL